MKESMNEGHMIRLKSSFCSETFIIIINVELFFCFIFVVENDTPFEVFDLKIKKN